MIGIERTSLPIVIIAANHFRFFILYGNDPSVASFIVHLIYAFAVALQIAKIIHFFEHLAFISASK